jgi:hypothetical protein
VRDFIENLAERYPGWMGEVVVEKNQRNKDNDAIMVSMVEWLETWASFCAEFPNCRVLVRFESNGVDVLDGCNGDSRDEEDAPDIATGPGGGVEDARNPYPHRSGGRHGRRQ